MAWQLHRHCVDSKSLQRRASGVQPLIACSRPRKLNGAPAEWYDVASRSQALADCSASAWSRALSMGSLSALQKCGWLMAVTRRLYDRPFGSTTRGACAAPHHNSYQPASWNCLSQAAKCAHEYCMVEYKTAAEAVPQPQLVASSGNNLQNAPEERTWKSQGPQLWGGEHCWRRPPGCWAWCSAAAGLWP